MKHTFSRFFGFGEKKETEEEQEREEVKQIPIDHIVPNRFQPRTIFSDDRIDELSQTIRIHGIIQPIIVRQVDDYYEIIAGERRYRAVSKLGWETIPAIVKHMDDAQTASVALIENLQREELSAIEEAVAYAKLLELHSLTQEALAQRLGKGQSTVANKLRLLKLPQLVQEALLTKKISERHARALLVLKEEEVQLQVLNEIIEKNYNVKQTEERVKALTEKKEPEKKQKQKRKSISRDVRLAMNTIRQSVDMVTKTGMTVDATEEELEDFYQITIRIPKQKE